MSPTVLHLAILRSASLLVPEQQRTEWLAEWMSELWNAGCDLRSCFGAFKDAFWFRRYGAIPKSYGVLRLDVPSAVSLERFPAPRPIRLESPVHCLAALAGLAAISICLAFLLPASRTILLPPPYPDARNLAMLSPAGMGSAADANGLLDAWPSVWLKQFRSWRRSMGGDMAFYAPAPMQTKIAHGRTAKLSIARTSADLFRLLGITVPPGHDGAPTLILTRSALNRYFDGDLRNVERVAGILRDDQWRLPGKVDGWLIENDTALAALPPYTRGFAVARLSSPAPGNAFSSIALPDRGNWVLRGLLMECLIGFLLAPITTSIASLGEYPATIGWRRWLFLTAKILLMLLVVIFGALDLAGISSKISPLALWLAAFGGLLAMRWVLADQRERCPVCLRLLANPIRIGQGSRRLLEWSGTELMCLKGHGLLHVPEQPGIWFSAQRWVNLDPSWSGLFP